MGTLFFHFKTTSLLQSFHGPTEEEGEMKITCSLQYCFDQRWNGTLRNRKRKKESVLVLKDICGKANVKGPIYANLWEIKGNRQGQVKKKKKTLLIKSINHIKYVKLIQKWNYMQRKQTS